ncbi:hypothetical protein [Streptomyces mirabilis]|uniref:hypothetical protein n=1 Tax=Streptomyces mirabilis TaxID=68239 RepID=UPI002256D9D8|nr:hypothetical protein [Streptomyces mirabilis]MCX4430238.1 hypothetical protein [Streptomyces mirabilis]
MLVRGWVEALMFAGGVDTGASVTAGELAGVLGRAYSAVGHLAYKEAPSGQEPAVHG